MEAANAREFPACLSTISVPFRASLVWSHTPEADLQTEPGATALASVLQMFMRLLLWARPWQQVIPLAMSSQGRSTCPIPINECIRGLSFELASSCPQC